MKPVRPLWLCTGAGTPQRPNLGNLRAVPITPLGDYHSPLLCWSSGRQSLMTETSALTSDTHARRTRLALPKRSDPARLLLQLSEFRCRSFRMAALEQCCSVASRELSGSYGPNLLSTPVTPPARAGPHTAVPAPSVPPSARPGSSVIPMPDGSWPNAHPRRR